MSIPRAINDPTGVWGNTPQGGNQVIVMAKNDSGGVLQHGDIVIWNLTRDVTSTTVAASARIAGVVTVTGDASTNAGTVPNQAPVAVCVGGIARVNIGANAVANNGVLTTSAVAGEADDGATAIGTDLGIALESQATRDVNDCILAVITR